MRAIRTIVVQWSHGLASALLMLLSATPASATLVMDLLADPGAVVGNGSTSLSAIHGRVTPSGGFVSPGPAPGCLFVSFKLTEGCATTGPLLSEAAGEIRSDLGRFRGGATANENGSSASAHLGLTDTLAVTGPLTFTFHVRLNQVALGGPDTTASFGFTLGIPFSTPEGTEALAPIFTLIGNSRGGDPDTLECFLAGVSSPDCAPLAVGSEFPLTLDLTTTLFLGDTVPLQIDFDIEAVCGEPLGCTALVDAVNTMFVGISGDFVSANGYSYPGFSGPGPGPGPGPGRVPLPSTALLVLGGLALMATRRRRG